MPPGDQSRFAIGVESSPAHYYPGSASDYTPTGGVLFNSAQLVREYFKYLGLHDSKMAPGSGALEPGSVHENVRQERIISMAPHA